jgi:hypothetical protein
LSETSSRKPSSHVFAVTVCRFEGGEAEDVVAGQVELRASRREPIGDVLPVGDQQCVAHPRQAKGLDGSVRRRPGDVDAGRGHAERDELVRGQDDVGVDLVGQDEDVVLRTDGGDLPQFFEGPDPAGPAPVSWTRVMRLRAVRPNTST